MVADVVGRDKPSIPKLSLDTQIPLLKIGWFEIQRMRNHVGVGLERQILVDGDREWIASRLIDPGVGQRGVGCGDRISEGLILPDEVQTEDALPIVKHTVRAADSHLTVTSGIPNQSGTRGELPPPVAF